MTVVRIGVREAPNPIGDFFSGLRRLFTPSGQRMLKSIAARSEHFDTEWYRRWAEMLGKDAPKLEAFGPGFAPIFFKVWDAMRFDAEGKPLYRHRKMWEWCVIAQALHERGMLESGRSGCGFAVGQEPLSSLFASFGVDILATDLGGNNIWKDTGQQTTSSVRWPNLISQDDFSKRVRFQEVDMKNIGALPTGSFDFTWSSCSIEHLGSLKAGFDFFEETLRLLKPGGVSVHTTEYNVSSNEKTVESGDTVLYRRRDLEEFAARIRRTANLAPLDLRIGRHQYDREADPPPYYTSGRQHIKFKLYEYSSTSVVLICSPKQ